ncbi:UDP-glucose 6-dehydrogenase [Succinivibrio dextrinosolvens]|uniref:UDP-glucose 6-dehydrogenase n=1 Tax=Succinivibrio dextrinosolvens TaxID=83771 RepID=UPI0009F5DDEC|nr:UDP-glucose 6-dehydrogenase [Succinivibrio dextrinosolvens]
MNNITIGIIGCGFVGGALKRWIEEHNKAVRILISDPYKGFGDNVGDADVIFISIHLPTEEDGSQDLSLLTEIISNLPLNKPIFIRTTVLPGTCDNLSKITGRLVYFMPEFLTERTAYDDFCSQPMIFTAEPELLSKIFIGKKYIEMSSLEAEITKYVHNVFGALKVTYFNCVYDLCRELEANYRKVQQGILLSGYINAPHTMVPGPDGKFGYGGKCFPKDVNAFTRMTKDLPIYNLLKELKNLNLRFRGEDN